MAKNFSKLLQGYYKFRDKYVHGSRSIMKQLADDGQKPEIMMNKNHRIVSKRKHFTAKKEKRLIRAGYGTKKGKFGFVKIGKMHKSKKSRKGKSKKMRGGGIDEETEEEEQELEEILSE